ncbi:MAG: hypothetical protein WKF55_05140 [Gemmatimonadaceae bacterium]
MNLISVSCIRVMAAMFAVALASSDSAAQATPPTPEPPSPSVDTGYVDYDGAVSFPLGIGFRLPSYNRVDGLVIPWGPFISLSDGKVNIDPTLTYRSDIGKIDPFVRGHLRLSDRDEIEIGAGRSTITNDDWIRSDLINSAAVFFVGSDARNYFRADRAVARYSRRITRTDYTITPSVGALTEKAWSTGSPIAHSSAPFSVLGRNDSLKMLRPNPAVSRGRISSALGRVDVGYERDLTTFNFDTRVEAGLDGPSESLRFDTVRGGLPQCAGTLACTGVVSETAGSFTQLTFGSKAGFPTFGTQRFAFRGHAVVTPGNDAPPQRFAYLGGAGTLATVDLLALGGDNLVYVEGEYTIPLTRPVLPFVGSPILSARYAAGGAEVGGMPDLVQNIGVGIGVRLLKAEYHIDPNYRKTSFSKKSAFSLGVSLTL